MRNRALARPMTPAYLIYDYNVFIISINARSARMLLFILDNLRSVEPQIYR